MIEQLFGSKTRFKLLKLFYSNPNRSFYVREITRKIEEQINSVRRELSNLLSIGIISSENANNKLFYTIDKNFKYYDALSQIFGMGDADDNSEAGSISSGDPVASSLSLVGNIELAFYTGQFTMEDASDVDLVIVGDVNESKLRKYISELESSESKQIRYAVFSSEEFLYRQQIRDRFIIKVLGQKRQIIIDKLGMDDEHGSQGLRVDSPQDAVNSDGYSGAPGRVKQ